MMLRITAFFAAALLSSCSPTPAVVPGSHSEQTERMDAVIELTTEGLIYNGVHLNLGVPMSDWVEVLGPARKNEINGTLIWDELGLRIHSRSFHDDRVENVAVSLLRRPIHRLPPPGVGSEPLKLYRGRLFLEGSVIDKSTTIRGLRGDVFKKNLRINCTKGTGNCFVSHEPRQKDAPNYIAFYADTRLDNSPIYEASVGQWFETTPVAPVQSPMPPIESD